VPVVATAKRFDIGNGGRQGWVTLQLLFEDGIGGANVGEGIVGVIEGLARIALEGFSKPVAVDFALDFEDVEEAGAFFR